MLRFLVIGDLHGVIPKLHTKNFDAIIAPGDICGDDIRPYYNKLMKEDFDCSLEDICPQEKQDELHKKSVKKGRKVLEFLDSIGKPVFIVPGNWDHTPYLDGIMREERNEWIDIKKGLKNIIDIEFGKATFKGLTLIGHGSTSAPEILENTVPEIFEEEFEEQQERVDHFLKVQKKLNKHFKSSKNPVIFLTHNVPYKTKLDKVNKPGTYAHGKHYGSVIAREFIEKYEPMLCIGGHIHEGFGKTTLKKTLCINAGFGGDVNTVIEIDEKRGKVLDIKFYGKNKVQE